MIYVPWRIYNLDFKSKIWIWTGIWFSELQIPVPVQIFLLKSKIWQVYFQNYVFSEML